MFPSFEIGPLTIEMYYVMMVLGVIAGLLFAIFFIQKKEQFDKVTSIKLLGCFALGGTSMYIGAAFFDSVFHSIELGRWTLAGISWLGGVIVSFPITILLIHLFVPKYGRNAVVIFSFFIPSIVLAHAFGRVGCFLEGCCYGKLTSSFFGVYFPGQSEKVLPTQLFEAIFELLLFVVMVIMYQKWKKNYLTIYLIAYGVFRFNLEFFRGDDRGMTGIFLSPSQLMSIIIIITGILLIVFKDKWYGKER
ncbi:MAG: prolipoprotein diacylglyceryl transferase [Bacilli bacterium]|nr:prolipoprotein diacylglyceryl transferase [Bacilli bacterium]